MVHRTQLKESAGDDGLTDYTLRYTRDSSTQTKDQRRREMLELGQEWQNRFHVYFPSDQTVRLAHPDPNRTAGTVCFSSRWWLGAKFPRGVLKDCESERGVLMHNKVSSLILSLCHKNANTSIAYVCLARGAHSDA